MPENTIIRRVTVQDLNIPLWESFGIAGGAQAVANNLLVTIELADGTKGYGEAAPLPPFNGETQASARHALDAAQSLLMGREAREWQTLAADLKQQFPHDGSARCALETALLDALARYDNSPLTSAFGNANAPLETDMTITTQTGIPNADAVAHAAISARNIVHRDIRAIKVKIGTQDVATDVARIAAVHAQAPDAPLLLDGNQGLTADSALRLLSLLQQRGITPVLLEQPVAKDDWEGMRRITREGGVAVAADETASDVAGVQKLIETRAASVVNIKLMKCGIAEALEIASLCKAHNIGLMIGGMVESILAMTVSACFASGLGGFTFIDLDTPLFMTGSPLMGGMIYHGGRLDLSAITSGHGVVPGPNFQGNER